MHQYTNIHAQVYVFMHGVWVNVSACMCSCMHFSLKFMWMYVCMCLCACVRHLISSQKYYLIVLHCWQQSALLLRRTHGRDLILRMQTTDLWTKGCWLRRKTPKGVEKITKLGSHALKGRDQEEEITQGNENGKLGWVEARDGVRCRPRTAPWRRHLASFPNILTCVFHVKLHANI